MWCASRTDCQLHPHLLQLLHMLAFTMRSRLSKGLAGMLAGAPTVCGVLQARSV